MTRFYGVEPKEANDLLRNLLTSSKIFWHGHISKNNVEKSFENTEKYSLDAWDGYILSLMEANQIRIIYTLDMDNFGKIDWIKAINPIPKDKMRKLSIFLEERV